MENRCRFLGREAPLGETEERRVYEGRGQADFNFKQGEILGSGRQEDPSAKEARSFLDRDR